MLEVISQNITCPSCGRKGAFIQRNFFNGHSEVVVKHQYCGYHCPIIDYVQSFIHSPNGDTFADSRGLIDRSLLVTSPHVDASYSIASLSKVTNGYFHEVHFSLTGLLRERACPLCRDDLFRTKKDKIVCTKGDFEISAYLFFQSFVREPFRIEEKKNTVEHTFEITSNHPSDLSSSNYLHLTEVVYRYDPDSNRNILIIDPPTTRDNSYHKFLKQIREITHPYFKIIEKVHPK